METTGFWCETLQVGDKVIVKAGYYDIPRVTTITRTTRTQVFLKDGPRDHEWAFWKASGYQVKKTSGLVLRLSECTDEAERGVEHQQRIMAISGAAIRIGVLKLNTSFTQEQVNELYACFVRLGLIDQSPA